LNGYYEAGVLKCIICHHSCKTCIGPNSNQCSNCPDIILFKRNILSSGSCNCLQGYFDDGTN